jgi:hypothetical protein
MSLRITRRRSSAALAEPLNSDSGKVLANFIRVETFGATNNHWVSATIDPKDPNLFEFQTRMVAANIGRGFSDGVAAKRRLPACPRRRSTSFSSSGRARMAPLIGAGPLG